MAGGDHIHFAMQIDGVQIDPKEWWDPHWIKDHIANASNCPVSANDRRFSQAYPLHPTGVPRWRDLEA